MDLCDILVFLKKIYETLVLKEFVKIESINITFIRQKCNMTMTCQIKLSNLK
jgi:hypothetical protein